MRVARCRCVRYLTKTKEFLEPWKQEKEAPLAAVEGAAIMLVCVGLVTLAVAWIEICLTTLKKKQISEKVRGCA